MNKKFLFGGYTHRGLIIEESTIQTSAAQFASKEDLFWIMGRSWVAVEQTLKFLPLARVRNDIVYEPEASRQCHSLQEQEEEISMSARLPPRNDIVSIYVKPPLNKQMNRCFGPLRRSRYIYIQVIFLKCFGCNCHVTTI